MESKTVVHVHATENKCYAHFIMAKICMILMTKIAENAGVDANSITLRVGFPKNMTI